MSCTYPNCDCSPPLCRGDAKMGAEDEARKLVALSICGTTRTVNGVDIAPVELDTLRANIATALGALRHERDGWKIASDGAERQLGHLRETLADLIGDMSLLDLAAGHLPDDHPAKLNVTLGQIRTANALLPKGAKP